MTRRRFLAGLGALTAGTVAYANRIEPHRVVVLARDLPIALLPPDLDGKLVVQLSDLHIGPTDADYLLDCIRRVGELRPELVVVTGDFMTSHGTEQVDYVARLMDQLPHPPLGVVGILGNHDYGPGWADPAIADPLAVRLTDVGVRVLRNERIDVAGLQLIGMDEAWAHRFDLRTAFAGYDPERAALALTHNPDTVDYKGWGNYQGWILAGHTHGGQCKPPFFDPPFLPVRNTRYTAGEFDLGDGRRLYINRGLGYHRRIRFNVRPEITAFTMRRTDCVNT
jgi:predicted MPP superfamily phosphohydrolase